LFESKLTGQLIKIVDHSGFYPDTFGLEK